MSTTLAGYAMDHFGGQFTFALLASVAACGLGLVWLMLPETRPEPIVPRQRASGGLLPRPRARKERDHCPADADLTPRAYWRSTRTH